VEKIEQNDRQAAQALMRELFTLKEEYGELLAKISRLGRKIHELYEELNGVLDS